MSASSGRGRTYLRGSASSSSASGSILSLHPAGSSVGTTAARDEDPPFEEIPPIPLDIKMDTLQIATEQHILKIQALGKDTEVKRLEKILAAIAKIRTVMRKKEQTPVMLKEYSRLKGVLIATLNEAQ
jgi:hypothetical protein